MQIDKGSKTITLPAIPKRVKKITGTRFAAILGLNPWSTPFEAWCDMTGAYKIPFEDTPYTLAGKIIEPKVIEYLDKKYYYGRHLLKGADEWFGKSKEQLRFDHFPEEKIFGGMWDARTKTAVFELKTSKRVEDWYKGGVFNAPEYYKLQGALYAYLMGLDDFRLVLTILEEKDYEKPEEFIPSSQNTILKTYSLRSEYPNFVDKLNYSLEWYEKHVTNPVSPGWDDKKDAEIIKALTTAHITPSDNPEEKDSLSILLAELEAIQAKIDTVLKEIEEDEKKLDALKKQIKPELQARMKSSDQKIILPGSLYSFEVTKTTAPGIDTDKLKADGLYEKYRKTGFTYKLNINPINKEEKIV
jgi:predicted phage-related endonuclease